MTVPVRKVLLQWAGSRLKDRRTAEAAKGLIRQLHRPERSVPIDAEFVRLLKERLSTIVELGETFRKLPSNEIPRQLDDWCRSAEEIGRQWPPQSDDDWLSLTQHCVRAGNRLFMATMSRTLADCLKTDTRLDRLSKSIGQMVEIDCQRCDGIPLPPEADWSVSAHAYFHQSDDREFVARLQSDTAELHDGSQDLCRRSSIQRTSGTTNRETSLSGRFSAELLGVSDDLSSAVSSLANGWPISCRHLVTRLATAAEKCRKVVSSDGGSQCEDSERFRQLAEKLEGLRNSLELWARAKDVPVRVDSAAEPEGPYERPSTDRLAQLVVMSNELASEEHPAIRAAAQRLKDLSTRPQSQAGEEERTEEQFNRDLLSCLVMFDDVILQTGATKRAPLQQTRDQLRKLLFAPEWGAKYVLLDDQLIGTPLSTCRELVEVERLVPRPSMRSDQIAEIRLPGYVFRQQDCETVLRKAKVFVVE